MLAFPLPFQHAGNKSLQASSLYSSMAGFSHIEHIAWSRDPSSGECIAASLSDQLHSHFSRHQVAVIIEGLGHCDKSA